MALEEDHIFLRELQKGHEWQLWVALQFLREGFIVQVPKLQIRPTHQDINEYTDLGDIFVFMNRHKYRFECKSRNLEFNSKTDYPYQTAFVDRVNTWKRKEGSKPHAIILVSQITGNRVIIPRSSEKTWSVKEVIDNVRNYSRNYFLVDKKHLKEWPDLIQWLRQL